jgi:hypothetical protein
MKCRENKPVVKIDFSLANQEESTEATCLPTVRQPIFRRHELYSGSFTELGKSDTDAKRKAQAVYLQG